jgi:hypothetical protein
MTDWTIEKKKRSGEWRVRRTFKKEFKREVVELFISSVFLLNLYNNTSVTRII